MEILFFRYANRLAGLFTKYVDEVIHAPETFPSLPVSPHITDMIGNLQLDLTGLMGYYTRLAEDPTPKRVQIFNSNLLFFGDNLNELTISNICTNGIHDE